MKKGILPVIATLVILLSCVAVATAADQQPTLPHVFYGAIVMPDDQPVPVNQVVEVHGEGIATGIAGNPLLSGEGGFGSSGATSPKLMAQGAIAAGTPLTFTVGGVPAQIYVVSNPDGWQDSIPYAPGEVTVVTLRINTTLTAGTTPTNVYVYPTVTLNEGSVVAYNEVVGTGGVQSTGGAVNPGSVPAYTTPPTRSPGVSGTSSSSGEVSGAAALQGGNGAASPGLVQAQSPSEGQPIPASWYIGGILIIVIIAIGGFYFGRMKKEGSDKNEKK
ncbi:hypothetical protein J2741_000184 [Methanolinea mesophila]|uniref:hypothetical protein n=1 Tax=Methanolinea mesophila TaxID=547055 RepID=UPI001AE9689D|nr:hypothetical protein [Methanolinea mesophila]MBP1927637.1 hypothetical protein [Methanolinea mesophila]